MLGHRALEFCAALRGGGGCKSFYDSSMRLISFDLPVSTPELQQLPVSDSLESGEVLFLATSEGLRMLRSGIREMHEELRGVDFVERIGIAPETALEFQASLRAISEVIATGQTESSESDGRFFGTATMRTSTEESFQFSAPFSRGSLLLAASRDEIKAHIAMCAATLDVLEEWEYEMRFGFKSDETRRAIADLNGLLE